MKRVSGKPKALPIASGMDMHARRLFELSLKQTHDVLAFGSERLVRWLNGRETVAEYLHYREMDVDPREYKLWLAKYGGDPKKLRPLDNWTEKSQKNILNLLAMMNAQAAELLRVRANLDPERPSILTDPKTVYQMIDIDRLLDQYAVVPKVLLQPSTGRFAVGYRTKNSYYASFGTMTFEEWETREAELNSSPPEPEQTEEVKANAARFMAERAHEPPYEEVQAAHAILDLARFGVLDRVRTCHCGTWFYAARSNRVHCGESCKHKRYANSDQFRKHRREYARELYKLKKKGIGAFSKNANTVKAAQGTVRQA
jgi:hypothetical protein